MTSTHSDPIQEIKTAEEKAKNKIEKEKSELDKKEMELKESLNNKVTEFERDLHEKNVAKLETVLEQAKQSKKSQLADAQSGMNSLISDAQTKEADAVNLVVTTFMNHIKA